MRRTERPRPTYYSTERSGLQEAREIYGHFHGDPAAIFAGILCGRRMTLYGTKGKKTAVERRRAPSWRFLFWSYYGVVCRIIRHFAAMISYFLECFSRLFSFCLQFVIAMYAIRMV